MKLHSILLFLLLAAACATDEVASAPIVVFRFECAPDAAGASELAIPDEQPGFFAPAEDFAFSYVGPTMDRSGSPAIAFEIRQDQAERWSDLTERHAGSRLAILVDGRVLSAPFINERLPGGGILAGGVAGFTAAERNELLRRLREQIPQD